MLQEFQDAISFQFNGIPYSILHFILKLPEKSIFPDNNQSPFPAFCSNPNIFQDLLCTILADQGFLFAEARPLAAGQMSTWNAIMCLDKKYDLMRNLSHDEAYIIDDIYQSLKKLYFDYEGRIGKDNTESPILKRLREIADPADKAGGSDWFRRLLRQIIQNGNTELRNAKIDCVEEALKNNLLTKEKLSVCFYWPENKETAIKDSYGDKIHFFTWESIIRVVRYMQ